MIVSAELWFSKNSKKVLAMKEVNFAQQYLELHSKVSLS